MSGSETGSWTATSATSAPAVSLLPPFILCLDSFTPILLHALVETSLIPGFGQVPASLQNICFPWKNKQLRQSLRQQNTPNPISENVTGDFVLVIFIDNKYKC